jgi:hypothetical protein
MGMNIFLIFSMTSMNKNKYFGALHLLSPTRNLVLQIFRGSAALDINYSIFKEMCKYSGALHYILRTSDYRFRTSDFRLPFSNSKYFAALPLRKRQNDFILRNHFYNCCAALPLLLLINDSIFKDMAANISVLYTSDFGLRTTLLQH